MAMKPVWDAKMCVFCGGCAAVCPVAAVAIEPDRVVFRDNCTHCGTCIDICPVKALRKGGDSSG